MVECLGFPEILFQAEVLKVRVVAYFVLAVIPYSSVLAGETHGKREAAPARDRAVVCTPAENTSSKMKIPEGFKPSDFIVWPNGGGLVHKNAKVDPSAYIRNSVVGPNAEIDAGAVVISSRVDLEALSDREKTFVGPGAVIKNSTLNRAKVEDDGFVSNSTMNGGEIQSRAVLISSTINHSGVENDSVIKSSTLNSNAWIEENVYIGSSTINGGEMEDRSMAINSTISGVEVRDDGIVRSSSVSDDKDLSDRSVIDNGRLLVPKSSK